MEKCEDCKQYKFSAIKRPEFGRVLCIDCNQEALRRNTPTQVVVRRFAKEAAR